MGTKGVISILGCGWLGFPLAKSLISSKFDVKGTTTTFLKLEVLNQWGIDPYLVQFSGEETIPDIKNFFNSDILIIAVPPGRRDPNGFVNYQQMIQFVCKELRGSNISKLILISSTSVYPDNNELIDEYSKISPASASGQLMADTERIIEQQNLKVVILRLAGLIGPGRMPGKFFSGKTQVANGLAPVNLIHLNDVIGIIHCLIENEDATGIFNGCAPVHPAKQDFYTLAAEREGLVKPTFLQEKDSWKIITSARVSKELKYQFEHPSPSDWISSS